MLFLILATLTAGQPASVKMITGSLDCRAIYRTMDAAGKSIEESKEMAIVFAQGTAIKYEADLAGKFFSMIEERDSGSLLAQITTAPNYTKGSVARGLPDNQGKFNLTEVDGPTVHRMECSKLPEVKPQRLGF